ncbi:unnamed protein product [Bursaphelenchus xylophilus]|uniref:(pine wood nematode) hypothetical protein n=1 Tax=Bursaphelenchus xylophilus TaxID=6326 RepID=A0A1I7S5T9_BURXY|nr:unnamed protein product [Bursaphelenchus xylophilus]CAG9125059.1 unnamed protein product [Bursaphelenchus xylophilus]
MWQWWVLNIVFKLVIHGLPSSSAAAINSENHLPQVDESIENLSNENSTEFDDDFEFDDNSKNALYRVESNRVAVSEDKVVVKAKEVKKSEWLREKLLAKNHKSQLPEEIQADQELIRLPIEQLELNETCKASVYRHKIRIVGCLAKNVYNRFCQGTCVSFFVPTMQSSKLKAAFRSCSICVPVETYVHQVTLQCPGRPEGFITRDVVRVKRCACRNTDFSAETE